MNPFKRRRKEAAEPKRVDTPTAAAVRTVDPVEIPPTDPLYPFLENAAGPVDVDGLEMDSPALGEIKGRGVKVVVPLVTQGELIGVLFLGPRLSQAGYGTDDLGLLGRLASQAAPALKLGQVVEQQEAQVRERERFEQEMHVAQLIQQQFLPRNLPELKGWKISAFYRSAREVGGDFYDIIELEGGRIGLVVGDVTGKGVPAALVMATTRSMIRSEAPRLESPSLVLERVNNLLVSDIPESMFVTCLYLVLDPENGSLVFANAGHDLPYVSGDGAVAELRATGMPLGLMEGMSYEEASGRLESGQTLLLHSDGIAEAHDPEREMFGFPRLKEVAAATDGERMIDEVLSALAAFTGPSWEQEDDITMLTLTRSLDAGSIMSSQAVLTEFEAPSEPGTERAVMDKVAAAAASAGLSGPALERLSTATSEAAMNAIEHGNDGDPSVPVRVRVLIDSGDLLVQITDQGGGRTGEPEAPDIEAKLEGLQKPRGWGLFLIKNMVDDFAERTEGQLHTLELRMAIGGGDDDV